MIQKQIHATNDSIAFIEKDLSDERPSICRLLDFAAAGGLEKTQRRMDLVRMRRAPSKIGEKSEEVREEDAIFVPSPFDGGGRGRRRAIACLPGKAWCRQAALATARRGWMSKSCSPLTSILSHRGERRYFAGLFSRRLSWRRSVCLLIADGNA